MLPMAKRKPDGNPIDPRATLAGETAGQLRRQIVTRFNPGDPLPSERELGRLLGVSRKTVRKAIDQLRAEGWLTRPRGGAPTVARPPTRPVHTTGLLFPFEATILLQSTFYREVTMGLHEAALENQRSVLYLFSLAGHKTDLLSAMMSMPNIRMVDSLVAFETFDEAVLAELSNLVPTVALDVDYRVPGVSTICFDHQASTQMAYKYLYDLGHRRIGIVVRPMPDPDPAVQARYQGLQHAAQQAGLSITPELEYQMRFDHVSNVADRILALPVHKRPTALVTCDNAWPIAAALAFRGLRIPQDISIVTIGCRENWLEVLDRLWQIEHPREKPSREALDRFICRLPTSLTCLSITTVELPARQMGRMGMQELIRRLEQPASEPTHQMLPMQLGPGNSTAPWSP